MATIPLPEIEDDMLPDYDPALLKGGVRGKYHARYLARPPVVRLDPDVAAAFPDAAAVNAALRMLAEVARRQAVGGEGLVKS